MEAGCAVVVLQEEGKKSYFIVEIPYHRDQATTKHCLWEANLLLERSIHLFVDGITLVRICIKFTSTETLSVIYSDYYRATQCTILQMTTH